VASRFDKLTKLGIHDWMVIHPEANDHYLMYRLLLRVKIIRAHEKTSAWDPNHVRAGKLFLGSPPLPFRTSEDCQDQVQVFARPKYLAV